MKTHFINRLATLLPGDRIVVPKSGVKWVQHHAIYSGYKNGRHWILENKDNIGVREITAEVFFSNVIEITRTEAFIGRAGYGRSQAIAYGRGLIGRSYDLLAYNCEHFANQVQRGKPESHQVRNTALGVGILASVVGLAALFLGGRRG